jgi:hypothetical protein
VTPSTFSLRLLCRLAAPASAFFASTAGAQTSEGTPANKSIYTLVNPTPRDLMRDLSTDRPDTTESPYTVDAGHVQLELSFVDFTRDRWNGEGRTTETLAVAPLLLKIGLLNNVDLQLGLDPYTRERSTDRASGDRETASGFGDTVLRLKVNLWGNDDGGTALALMPFVAFPTGAEGLSSDHVEGGLIVPFAIKLPHEFNLGLMAEIDLNRSSSDDRYVVDFVHTVTIGRPLVGNLSGYVEYAGFANFNHDEEYRGYFDAGVTYGLTRDIQLDAGLRVGLTRTAEDIGMFCGISLRF